MVTIMDVHGRKLTDVTVHFDDGAHTIVLSRPDRPDALLGYYFLRGERRVMVALDEGVYVVTLETRWQGTGRVWVVTTDAPVRTAAPALKDAPAPGQRALQSSAA